MRKKFTRFGGPDWNKAAGDVYTGAADAGKLYTEVTTVFAIIVCICLIILGIYLIRKPATYTAKTTLTVTSVTPEVLTSSDGRVSTTYNVLGTTPLCGINTVSLLRYNQNVAIGQTIPVWMTPNCASTNAMVSEDNPKVIGWVLLAVSVVMLMLSAGRLYLVRNSKAFAAVEGANAARNATRYLFR